MRCRFNFLPLDLIAGFRNPLPETTGEEPSRIRGAQEIGVGEALEKATAAQGNTDEARFGWRRGWRLIAGNGAGE